MTIESTRPAFWQHLRKPFDQWMFSVPMPRINPDALSVLTVLLAICFVVAMALGWEGVAILLLAGQLFMDGLDGAVARKQGWRITEAERRHGQKIDFFCDRLCEGIMFSWPAFMVPWFALCIINSILAYASFQQQRALVQPLRFVFLLVLLLQFVF